MFYSSSPKPCAFLRDSLGLASTDVGGGWLIFDLPEAELGCHPTEKGDGEAVPSGTPISFYCDDLKSTMRELRARGVEFVEDATDVGYEVRTSFHAPGDFTIELYEPRYEKAEKSLEDEIERGLRLSARGLDDRAGDRETSVGVREDDDALAGHGIGQGAASTLFPNARTAAALWRDRAPNRVPTRSRLPLRPER